MKEFIGLQKTCSHCADHYDGFKKKHGYNLRKAIEEEGKKFYITPKFIDELKILVSDHKKIVNVGISKEILLTLSILPTKVQIEQKEKIQIFMERILENGMQFNAQISSSIFNQNSEEKIKPEKQRKNDFPECPSQQFMFKHPKAIKRRFFLSLQQDILKKLQKNEESVASLIIQFSQIIEIDFKSTKRQHKNHNNSDEKLKYR